MKKTIIYIGLTLSLIIFGFKTAQLFLDISISELNLNNVSITWITMIGQFQQNILYTIVIGLLPLLYFISSKISRVNSQRQKISIILITLIIGVLIWQFRIYQLNLMFESFTEIKLNVGNKTMFLAKDLKLEFYLFSGFIIGALISALTLRQINNRKLKE